MGAEMSKSLVVCQIVIRWFLTLLLIYAIYLETGFFTSLFAILVAIEIETNNTKINHNFKVLSKSLKRSV